MRANPTALTRDGAPYSALVTTMIRVIAPCTLGLEVVDVVPASSSQRNDMPLGVGQMLAVWPLDILP